MPLTLEQVEVELNFIKEVLNKLQTAVVDNLASKAQLRQLNLLRQKEIDELKARVTALEAEVTALLENS